MLSVIVIALIFGFIDAYYDQRTKVREALRKQVEEFETPGIIAAKTWSDSALRMSSLTGLIKAWSPGPICPMTL
jgi:hypothetical protein